MRPALLAATGALACASALAQPVSGTFSVRQWTPETALAAARAALESGA